MCYKNFNQCGQKILTTIVHHQIQHEFCIHTHIYLTVFKILWQSDVVVFKSNITLIIYSPIA